MSKPPYVIDVLLKDLREAWARLDVSAEDYAKALKAAGRRTIHFNTLRKLDQPGWSPSVSTFRDLEEVLIRNPLPKDGLKQKVVRRRRASLTACRYEAHLSSSPISI